MCMYMRIIRVPKIWFCSFHKPQIFSIIHKFSLRLHVISHINTVIELMHTIFNRSTFCFIFVTFGRSSPCSYFHFHVFSLIYVLLPFHYLAFVHIVRLSTACWPFNARLLSPINIWVYPLRAFMSFAHVFTSYSHVVSFHIPLICTVLEMSVCANWKYSTYLNRVDKQKKCANNMSLNASLRIWTFWLKLTNQIL